MPTSIFRFPYAMRAALFREPGPADVVRYEEVPTPAPGPGEVLIRVRAAAMNHLDVWIRRGLPIDTTMPHIGGSDIAGTVAQCGPGVEGWSLDDRVLVNPSLSCRRCRECDRGEVSLCPSFRILGEHTDGGFAEFVVVPSTSLHRIPETIDFETASCLPVSYQTAWRAVVHRAAVRPGEDVLVLGASGGTAIASIQIALLAGARVHAVTSGSENVARLRSLGAEFVYDRMEVDFSREVFLATGKRGVDVVIENVGSATWNGSIRTLAADGRLVTYGATSGHDAAIDLRRLFWKQLRIIGTTMASLSEFEEMLRAAWSGRLVPVIDSVLPLSSANVAHQRLESGQQFGKLVLVP